MLSKGSNSFNGWSVPCIRTLRVGTIGGKAAIEGSCVCPSLASANRSFASANPKLPASNDPAATTQTAISLAVLGSDRCSILKLQYAPACQSVKKVIVDQ